MVSEPPPVSSPQLIAIAAALREAAAAVEQREKAIFAAAHPVKTRIPALSHRCGPDGEPTAIGTVSVTPGRPTFHIDKAEAIPYLIDRYGPDAVEQTIVIRPQYETSLIAEAKAARAAKNPLPPGVSVTTGARFTTYRTEPGVDGLAEVTAMVRDGVLDLRSILGGLAQAELGEAP